MADEVELSAISHSPTGEFSGTKVEKPKTSLHHAARDNSIEIVEKWLRVLSGPDSQNKLNKKDHQGYAPLHYAAKFNRYKILIRLIEAGADPNIKTREEKYTPLHFAARYTPRIVDKEVQQQESEATKTGTVVEVNKRSSSVRAVQYLVNLKRDKKVQINVKAQYGVTPLHLACQRGNQTAVSVLLRSNDVIVNSRDDSRDTPLHEASLNGHSVIVENLLTRMKLEDPNNMDINLQNDEFQTPLHLACREGFIDVVKLILKQFSDFQTRASLTKTRDNEENTALHLACESGQGEIVHCLILNGADPTAVKIEDVTPIHIAARYGFTSVVDKLMSTDESLVSAIDIYDQTPLHYAANHNEVVMINFLLDRGADIAAVDTESYTPLMIAVTEGHVEAFNALLERGSSIDDVDEDGKTVVHLALEANSVGVLQCILKDKKGLEMINSTDTSYNTPLHLAAIKGSIEAIEVLLNVGKDSIKVERKNEFNKTPTHLAASKGHLSVIEALLRYQKDCILDEDEDGNKPLHLACLNGYYKSAKVLLKYQADFDARNASLWTPIDCAAYKGHEKAVMVLIDAGADVNPTDKLQTTPLHLASQEGHLNVVKLLLDNGAEVGKCSNKLNSLDMAINNGHEDIALAIIQSKKWKSALRNTTISPLGKVTTPLRKLIKKMPEVAEEVFSRCSVGNDTKDGKIISDSKKYKVTFNYEFLEDFRDEKDNVCERLFKKKRRYQEVFSDAGDTDEASVDPFETKENKKVDIFESVKPKKHNYTTDWGPIGFKKSLHPLSIMVEYNRTDLLKHPLVTSLLKLKWRTYGRNAYFSNLFLYVLFLIFITAFALVSLNPQSSTCTAVFDNSFERVNNSQVYNCSVTSGDDPVVSISGEDICSDGAILRSCGFTDISCGQCGWSSGTRAFLVFAASLVVVVAMIRLIFEAFQFVNLKLYYLVDWVNWIEVILFVNSILFVFVYNTECLCPRRWQWQLGCIAVFLTWIDLIIFIRKLPLTGIYVLMFVHIFYTFCKMIILTILLILAFSLAFYMAFFDPTDPFARASFSSPGRAIVKTMTMTTGEFEYDSIFRQFPGGAEDDSFEQQIPEIPFLPVSFLLWIIFLVLMPILLTNLLVGLAVDDIKGIQEAAVLQRLALQVDLALNVEELLPIRLRRYFITEEFTVQPNRTLSFVEKLRYSVFGTENGRFDSPENISNALHPQPTPIEQVQQQTHSLALSMKKMKDTLNELAERNINMEKLIRELAGKPPIPDSVEEIRSFI